MAFSIPGVGQYSYIRSPQGMNSSPAYFQRLLDYVLTNIKRTYEYIDDVVISVQSHDDNLATLRQVFSRFRKHHLKVKPSKCQFGTASITYLGYDICANKGITPGQAKTEVIRNWPCPTSVREIRGFLGLCSIFRRAIKDFSVLSSDLNKLVRKNSGYTKGPLLEQARQSFLRLQKALPSCCKLQQRIHSNLRRLCYTLRRLPLAKGQRQHRTPVRLREQTAQQKGSQTSTWFS